MQTRLNEGNTVTERGPDGKFITGNGGGPGRPPKEREERYLEIARSTVTFKQWAAIIKKAADQAERGNATARKFLADYLMGPPPQRLEHSGPDGGPVGHTITYINDWRSPTVDGD